ncbi:MAG: GNAT family N-acetyltransferase [Chloroflexi bacterium]|nr:GNAT family N-acetyltransferase [Chloroflexota bacterium]MBI3931695.1 GNAT family N-acetyltransferase [Chloroflexota bacterium]
MRILQNTPEFKPSEVVVAEEVIDSYLHDPIASGYYTLVAEIGSTVVGYICYGPTPLTEGTWDLYWAAVTREERGQGIGSALWKAAEAEIKQAQGRLAIIETSSTSEYENTRRFHLGRGYGEIARIPDFYAPGDDKLILQKRLR